MTKLFYRDKPIIGLDISQTGLKVMAVDVKKWLVLGYGSVDLDPIKMQTALDKPDGYLIEGLTKLLKEAVIGELPSNHVTIGLPMARTFSHTFIIPASAESTLANAVELEVEQYIPLPMNSLYIDYEIVERNEEALTVAMSAVPRTLVDICVDAAKAVDLRPILIEPGINSVARIIETVEEGNLPTLIVDIGTISTDIAVMDAGVIRIGGSLNVGGNTFTVEIAKKLDIALENAHQLKVLSGLSAGPRQAKVTSALTPSLQRIVAEIRKVLRYYTERLNENYKIEQVLVVGAGSNMPGIGDYFTNELVMAARVASPWQKLDFGTLTQPSKYVRPRYIAAAGLASINSNSKGLWQ